MKKNIDGFTIIELLVFIAIFMIITLGLMKVDIKTNIDLKKFESFNNQIIANIETIRNNSLNGKTVKSGTDLINPYEYRLGMTKTSMVLRYKLESTSTTPYPILDNLEDVDFSNRNEITDFQCLDLDNNVESSSTNVVLIFNSDGMTTSCGKGKIVKINTISGKFTKSIYFNPISGIVTKE